MTIHPSQHKPQRSTVKWRSLWVFLTTAILASVLVQSPTPLGAADQLATPVVSSATQNGQNVTFGWNAIPDRGDYHIQWFFPSGHNVYAATQDTSYTIDTEGHTGQFCLEVRAVAAGRDSELSNRLCTDVTADAEAPSRPGWQRYSFDGTSSTYTWTASTDNVAVTGYRVQITGTDLDVTLPATARSHTFHNIPARSSSYLWRVTALDAAGNTSLPRHSSFRILTEAQNNINITAVDDFVAAYEAYAIDNGNYNHPLGYITTTKARALIDAGYLDNKYADIYWWDLMVYRCGSGDNQRAAVFSTANKVTTDADKAAFGSGCYTGYSTRYGHDYYRATKTIGQLQTQCLGATPTVELGNGEVPTEGDDVIIGTPGDDTIFALGGNDRVCGGGGNDTILGGDGDDTIDGGDGDDQIDGQSGHDTITGGAGADDLRGFVGNDTISGGDGNDLLNGYTGDDVLNGDSGDDVLFAYTGNDQLYGGTGDDKLGADEPTDITVGGAGIDICNNGTQSECEDTGIPPTPTGLTADFDGTHFTFTWTPSEGADEYDWELTRPNGSVSEDETTAASLREPVRVGEAGEHCLRVMARGFNRSRSGWSAPLCLHGAYRLATPVIGSATANATQVVFDWADVPGRAEYHWALFKPGTSAIARGATQSSAYSVAHNGLAGQWCLEVVAIQAGRDSAVSQRKCANVAPPPPPRLATPVINDPGLLQNKVRFTWGAVPDRAEYHWAVIYPDGGIVRGATTSTNHNITIDGQVGSHCLEVRAVQAGRDSLLSERKCATTPSRWPRPVLASGHSINASDVSSINFKVVPGTIRYQAQFRLDGTVVKTVNGSSWSVGNATLSGDADSRPGEWCGRVRALGSRDIGHSTWTAWDCTTVAGPPPLATPEISFVSDSRGDVFFRWGAIAGSAEYRWTVIEPDGRRINGSTTDVYDSVPHGTIDGNWCVEVQAILADRDSALSARECTTVVLGSVTGLLQNFEAGPVGSGTGGISTPLGGIEICATPTWADMDIDACTTSAQDGTFTLGELPVGQHRVMLVDPLGRYFPKCIADLGRDCSLVQSGTLRVQSSNPDIRWSGFISMEPVPPPSTPGVPTTPSPDPTDTSPPRWDSDPWATNMISDLTHSSPRLYFKWENFSDQPLTDPSNVNSVPSSGIKEFELTVNGTTRIVSNGERQISHDLLDLYLVTLGRPDDRIQTYVEVPGAGTYDVGVRIVDNAGNKSQIAWFRLTFSPGSTQGVPGTPSGPSVVIPPPAIPLPTLPPIPTPGQGPPDLGPGAWGCRADDFVVAKGNTFIEIEWSIEPAGKNTRYRSFIYDEDDFLLDAEVGYVPEASFEGLLRNRTYTIVIQSSTLTDDFLGQCTFIISTRDDPSFVNVEFPAACQATITPGFESFNVSWPAATPAAEIGEYEVRLFNDEGARVATRRFDSHETAVDVRIPVWAGFETGASYSLEVRAYNSGEDSYLWTRCGDSRVDFQMLTFNVDSSQAWAVCGGVSSGTVAVAARDACVWVNASGQVAIIDSLQVSLGFQANIEGYVALGYANTSNLNAIGGTSLCGNVSIDWGAGVNLTSCRGHTSGLLGFNGARVHFVGVSAGVGLPASISVGLSRGEVDILSGSERADALEAFCEDVDSAITSLPKPPVC